MQTEPRPDELAPSSPSAPVSPSALSAAPFFDSSGALCGWLHKGPADCGPIGPADRPKLRWFVFNEEAFELEYFRTPKDVSKLGSIPIDGAAFLPEATLSTDRFYVLSIVTQKKTYKLYHAQKSTLDFWRQALQRRRSSLQMERLRSGEVDPEGFSHSEGQESSRRSASFAVEPHLEVEPRVHESNRFVGPHTQSQMQSGISDISMRNFSTEARNKFKAFTSFMRLDSDSSNKGGASKQRNSATSVAEKDNGPCESCRQMRGENRDLQDNLAAHELKLVSLQRSLQLLDTPSSNNDLQARVKELEIESTKHEDQIKMFKEVLQHKDDQIVGMQTRLAELEENPFGENQFRDKYTFLADQVNAYKEQNQTLNAEILNLRGLFGASVEHERELIDAVKKLHEIYSMAIMKLKKRVEELSVPQLGHTDGSVSSKDQAELLADALIDSHQPSEGLSEESMHLKNLLLVAQGQMTDEYGFYIVRREFETQQMIDLTQLGPQVNISQYLESPPIDHDREASLNAKWERFLDESGLKSDGSKPMLKSPELKLMLRQGCPARLRGRAWRALILYYIGDYRMKNLADKYYQDRLNSQPDKFLVERKQIELDLHRSLPENCFFNVEHQPNSILKIDALKRVLLAFCVGDSVGYCQGLDRIASILLLNVDEEMAFWGLQVVVNHLRSSEYYTRSLRDAQVDQRVFKDLVASHVPKVSTHLSSFDVDVSLFSFNWFLTLFVDGFHWSVFMKIWDAFLFEGDKVIFRYAIAVIIYLEPILLHCREVTDIYRILRNAGRYVKDHIKLTDIAFSALRSFPKRRIKQKRLHYTQVVDQEIRQANEERARRRNQTETLNMFRNDSDDDGQ